MLFAQGFRGKTVYLLYLLQRWNNAYAQFLYWLCTGLKKYYRKEHDVIPYIWCFWLKKVLYYQIYFSVVNEWISFRMGKLMLAKKLTLEDLFALPGLIFARTKFKSVIFFQENNEYRNHNVQRNIRGWQKFLKKVKFSRHIYILNSKFSSGDVRHSHFSKKRVQLRGCACYLKLAGWFWLILGGSG